MEGRRFSSEERNKATILLERYAKQLCINSACTLITPSTRSWSERPNIRPMDLFGLTGSSYFSLNGLLLTYTIVLLQFKFSEDHSKDTDMTMGHAI